MDDDPHCLAALKHYRSLMPLAQEAHKPMFFLKPADGAIGGHAKAVQDCYSDFRHLAASHCSTLWSRSCLDVYKKKLIEVALPLDAINTASAREKSIRHGHPSTLHLWWARRPLAAARAVIFAQMVDDPSAHPDLFPTEKAQEKERQRLFRIIEELVLWENTTNEKVLAAGARGNLAELADGLRRERRPPARQELFDRHKLPAFHDPFAGGGRCRWRRSGWGWKPTPATSTPWRC